MLDVRAIIDRIQIIKETNLRKWQRGIILSKLFEVERHILAVTGTISWTGVLN